MGGLQEQIGFAVSEVVTIFAIASQGDGTGYLRVLPFGRVTTLTLILIFVVPVGYKSILKTISYS